MAAKELIKALNPLRLEDRLESLTASVPLADI